MESKCNLEGDADLYGLGVRIASYISWLTTVIAYHLDSLIVNCILQLSLLIATIYKIADGTANTGEVYLMKVFGAGGGFAFTMETTIDDRHTSGFGSTLFGDILRSLLLLAYRILSLWFWYHGRNALVGF
ncbi:hypothetical protein FCULG_00000128 [Fusarium culmorum]|uniref:Uncharacterized protein n=1 Tax=Fusarium culmorum TaxID=5516 RepID=A0A2T4GLW8_FUSCU|nr:hypothetical protein FCULG_00000128 [Fusarium culmorum]